MHCASYWPLSFHCKNHITPFLTLGNFGTRYTISVCIKHLDPQSGALLDCLATESLIIASHVVVEPTLNKLAYIVLEPEFFPIQNCCSYKGSMLLGFDTSSTVIAPNTIVDIGILGKNMSVVNVKYFKAELVQLTNWTAYDPRHIRRKVIAQTCIGANPVWGPLKISNFLNGDHMYMNPTLSEMEASRVQGHLRVPFDAMESYQGHIIQITHKLVITAVTTGTFFVQSPQSSISVHVVQDAFLESISSTLDDVDYLGNTDHHDIPTAMAHVMSPTLSPQVAELLSTSSDSQTDFTLNSNLDSSPLEDIQEDLQALLLATSLSYGSQKGKMN